ncbi:MAG: protein kinase [candidate division NC10 bacterium]|nr:protein kinase [candidate division NC10 bacterium]
MAERTEAALSGTAAGGVRLGQYIVLEELGGGGMARLYRARHASLARVVALKELHPRYRDDPAMRERFRREAEVATGLAHDHIVRAYEFWEDAGRAFLALEFVDGLDGKSLLQRAGRFPSAAAVAVGAQICDALAYAHRRGLIHRDLKPSNILLGADGRAKLSDFGIAILPDSSALTRTGQAFGTPAYMSPEQIQGEPLTPASDLFALGIVLYEFCTGVKPFPGDAESSVINQILTTEPEPPRSVAREIPWALDRVIMQTLKRRPAQRYPEAAALKAALLDAVPLTGAEAQKVLADFVAAGRRSRRGRSGDALPSARRARTALLLGTAGLAAMVGVAFPGWLRWHTQGQIPALPGAQRSSTPAATPARGAPSLVPASAPPPTPGPSPTVAPSLTHTVQPGETLGAIALRYYREARHVPLLLAANRLDPRTPLRPGQAIRIPIGEPYEVRPGDSVSSIAERELGDSRRAWVLLELNGLREPDRLLPGRTLRLPIRVSHEVRRAETLAAIAERYYGSATFAARIARYNFLPDGAAPTEGTRLEIPLLPPAAPRG